MGQDHLMIKTCTYLYVSPLPVTQPVNLMPPAPDLLYILTPPVQYAVHLTDSLWKLLTATLCTHFEKPVKTIWQLIPKTTPFHHYGQACQLEDGNTIHGRELIQLQSDSQDMSYE